MEQPVVKYCALVVIGLLWHDTELIWKIFIKRLFMGMCMLLIKTHVKESRLHGVGVFSSELVSKGTIVWQFCDGVDLIVAEKDAWGLWRECLDHYGWLEDGFYVFCNDNAKYINHSLEANLEKLNDTMIASRDIQPGEEITENYLEVYGELWKY